MHRPRPGHLAVFILLATGGFVVATVLDRPLLFEIRAYRSDLHEMLRAFGFLPTWMLVGAGMDLAATARRRWSISSPGAMVVLSASLAGLLSEITKLLVRRERPHLPDPLYVFRPWADGLDSGGLGFPSGHAAIAFGAAFMLCRLYPRASIVWLAAAVGCGTTRVMSGAHFVSDVYGSAVTGFVTAWIIASLLHRPKASHDATI